MKLKVVVSLFAVSFCGAAVDAQEVPKLDLFAGYTYVRANPSGSSGLSSFNMNGGDVSVAYHAASWLSGVFDVGGYHTSRSIIPLPIACPTTGCPANGNFKGNLWTYLAGPRVNLPRLFRFTPYAQALFGVAHATSVRARHATARSLFRILQSSRKS